MEDVFSKKAVALLSQHYEVVEGDAFEPLLNIIKKLLLEIHTKETIMRVTAYRQQDREDEIRKYEEFVRQVLNDYESLDDCLEAADIHRGELSDLQDQVDDLETNVEAMEETIDSLKKENANLKKEKLALEKDLNTLKVSNAELVVAQKE